MPRTKLNNYDVYFLEKIIYSEVTNFDGNTFESEPESPETVTAEVVNLMNELNLNVNFK